MTREEFIAAIRESAKAKNIQNLPIWVFIKQSGMSYPDANKTLREHFDDSWSTACRAAAEAVKVVRKIKPFERQIQRPSPEECVTELKRVAEHLGVKTLSRELYRKHAGPRFSPSTIIRSLRKIWPECLKSAGLESCEKAKMGWGLSREEAIEELRRIAAIFPAGTQLTIDAFENAQPQFECRRIARALGGSWAQALAAAGLAPAPTSASPPTTQISLDILATEFQDATTHWKHVPSLKLLCYHTKRSKRMYSSNRPPDHSYAAFQRIAIERLLEKNVAMPPETKSLLEAHLKRLKRELIKGDQ